MNGEKKTTPQAEEAEKRRKEERKEARMNEQKGVH